MSAEKIVQLSMIINQFNNRYFGGLAEKIDQYLAGGISAQEVLATLRGCRNDYEMWYALADYVNSEMEEQALFNFWDYLKTL